MRQEHLDADHREADRRALRFSVATKAAPRQRWIDFTEPQRGLKEAMQQAQALAGLHYEVGVFVRRGSGGYIYWTSRLPDLLSSTVITMEVS